MNQNGPALAPDRNVTRTPQFLIDLETLDLQKKILTREDLERWNPHRGPIAQLDGVIWHSEGYDAGVAVKHVRDDEFWVEGHFPDRALMPGILMVEAGAQLISFLFYSRRGEPCIAGFTRIDNTVFRAPVVPGDNLYLICREVKYSPRRFISDVQGVVNGKLVFESRVTGMVL
ncbi:MAG: hypothetical protein EA376_12215 [Phycisphaeraceae bacterium]|nr:MAG: hypothetical protein EA376_12215 [Phycisphaeraceae bacterium]